MEFQHSIEQNLIFLLEPQHKHALHFSWLHLRPETRSQPLHWWNNIFHRLQSLSDSCGANVAWKWGICFHKFLWHRSTNNEALQTWDSISGDSPFWSRRLHYVILCTAVQTFQPQDARKKLARLPTRPIFYESILLLICLFLIVNLWKIWSPSVYPRTWKLVLLEKTQGGKIYMKEPAS